MTFKTNTNRNFRSRMDASHLRTKDLSDKLVLAQQLSTATLSESKHTYNERDGPNTKYTTKSNNPRLFFNNTFR